MLKKITMVVSIVLIGLILTSCTPEEKQSDGDYLRSIRDQITFDSYDITDDIVIPEITDDQITVKWVSSNPTYLDIDGTVLRPDFTKSDANVSLTLSLELNGTIVTKVFEFTVLSEDIPDVIELNTNETDNLAMNFNFEDSEFIADGVGEVTLVRCVDGDTAFFTEGGSSFSVRFLGINTPESTAKFEPWGKAASDYTCDKLTNASQIVLQADPAAGRLDSYGERWLAWVWYDGRLLNLELVEQAYSKSSGSVSTMYGSLITQVNLNVQYSKRRVWGEIDPDFDYSLDGVQLTLEELVTNHTDYYGLKVVITGVVSRKIGAAVFVQQGDYGIYIYNRAWAPDLTPGNEVLISGLTVTYYPDELTGALQVSGYQARDDYSQVLSTGNIVEPKTITIAEITTANIGSLLKLEHLTVISIVENQNDSAFTVTLEDAQGNTITARRDADLSASAGVTPELFTVGSTYTIVAPLSRYIGIYQLMLSSSDDITIE